MTGQVRQERDGIVAKLVIASPPVNALGAAVRAGLADGLAAALADPGVGAIVILAEGRIFSAGADIREFGTAPGLAAPSLSALCNQIEASTKPVIAAVQGAALGGGLELALAAHVRLAIPAARFGLPEVTLGLLPGAGGTQRMPRLIGAEAALRMMLTGAAVDAAEAVALGLIDGVVEDGLEETAVALGADMAAGGHAPLATRDCRDGMRDATAYQGAIAAARAALGDGRLPAPARIVDCVEAAQLLPFGQGLEFERAAFDDLVAGPESAGLRHAFFAERRAAVFPEATALPRAVVQVGVVGLGRTGAGIVHGLVAAGMTVRAVAADDTALVAGLARVADLQDAAVVAGQMTVPAREAAWDRLMPGADLTALAACDLVFEALPEDAALKASVLRGLDAVLRPSAVIATSVSWLDPGALAAQSGRAPDVVGLHIGAPVERTRLAEVAVSPANSAEAVATVVAVLRQIGKLPLRVAAGAGLVVNRVMAAVTGAGDHLLDQGATPAQIDAALSAFGFAIGPYAALDLAGLERPWAYRQGLGDAAVPAELADLLVEAGRLGVETGRGYHMYDPLREDPEVLALLAALRSAKGITPRPVGRDEIVRTCLSAAANEGARLLGEGVALRASDIDAALIAGCGFPRWEGGPMFWAARRGLIVLRADLHRLAAQAPDRVQVAPLIDKLIRDGKSFADLDPR